MKKPVWLRSDMVLAIQEQLLAEFDGVSGIRDTGMLESALGRPPNQHAYGKPTVFELAAAYAYGLVRNHPFAAGNKRLGFVAAVTFLELNGYAFTASEVDATLQTLALAAREIGEEKYASWLKANSRKA